jgi:predicted Zn-dependent protease
MYITTGMLKTIRTEHELVSILAHEISYADGEVLLEKIKDEYGGDVLFEVINGFNPPELPVIAEELQNMAYSEQEVMDADSYAVDIICDFLYDPHGMRDFLGRVIENEEENLDWLDNRKGTADRARLIELSASGCGPGGTFESRYQEYLLKLP